jgi:hypothetical protein
MRSAGAVECQGNPRSMLLNVLKIECSIRFYKSSLLGLNTNWFGLREVIARLCRDGCSEAIPCFASRRRTIFSGSLFFAELYKYY